MNSRIKFSGIVVTYNEKRYLRSCLKSLSFCDQLIVIDLGSTDGSIDIAKQEGAEIIYHERVPIVEQIREKAVEYARFDWLIFIDPDEVLPKGIENDLRYIIIKNPNIGAINLPWRFYFKNKALNFSFWGIERTRPIALYKSRNQFTSNVHRGIQLLNGYNSYIFPPNHKYTIKHFWADSYCQLLKKHWRYIKHEGESRYNKGEIFYWTKWIREIRGSFIYSFITCKGFRGGFLGLFLSLFYSFYICMSWLSLWRYQEKLKLRKSKI